MEKYIVLLFILLMIAEIATSVITRDKRYNFKETVENIGTGMISLLFDHGFSLLSYPFLLWIYNHYKLFEWKESFSYFFFLFLFLDLIEYWFHRLSHVIPVMWTAHKVHHQSKFFNLSVGLRTSVLIPFFNIGFYCLIPLAGFHPAHLLIFIFVQGIYQLFVHTEYIKKLGLLDLILVTPSVHRVHHGTNAEYLDKNFGKMLVLWDHLFGTFAPENEKVVYGATDSENEEGIINCQVQPFKKWWTKRFSG
ncbi:MAG: sterol desaturase [Bacteroidetes bacterium]|jgi:sterol desaturase/sphingolipid hydroxylase (fatty acid hydroxylase superfamily)|nr:sterol desaturase [Bacteroidota bacterium]